MSRLKLALVLFCFGFMFLVLDIPFGTNISYPHPYENTDKVIGEYQYYNINSNYGATCTYKVKVPEKNNKSSQINNLKNNDNIVKVIDKVYFKNVQVDILTDLVGFLFILIGAILIVKCCKKFYLAILCAIAGIIVKIIMFTLPFVINGISLVNAAFFIGIIYLIINITTIYMVVSSLLLMIPGPWCRDERKWCKIIWFASFASQALATFAFWLGSDFTPLRNVGWAAFIVTALLHFSLWFVLMRAKHYLRGTYEKFYS